MTDQEALRKIKEDVNDGKVLVAGRLSNGLAIELFSDTSCTRSLLVYSYSKVPTEEELGVILKGLKIKQSIVWDIVVAIDDHPTVYGALTSVMFYRFDGGLSTTRTEEWVYK